MLGDDLTQTLSNLVPFLDQMQDPWWVLGSAAVALKGFDPGDVRDVDVLVSVRDAEALTLRWTIKNEPDGGTALYRSDYFLRPDLGPLPVEIMAGYKIFRDGIWLAVWPETREQIEFGGALVFVPDDNDLLSIFRALGREKDLKRISVMRSA